MMDTNALVSKLLHMDGELRIVVLTPQGARDVHGVFGIRSTETGERAIVIDTTNHQPKERS